MRGNILRTTAESKSPLRAFTRNEPLTGAELDHLEDFLGSCKGGKAMNVEQLDGFFASLIAGAEIRPATDSNSLFLPLCANERVVNDRDDVVWILVHRADR